MKDHKFYQLAYDAHRGTSFSPEKRAESLCLEYDEHIAEMTSKISDLGGDPAEYLEGYTRRWTAWLSAKSRCLSAMITGPSKFPVRQQEKARNIEHKRSEELTAYTEGYITRLKKRQRRAEQAATDPLTEARQKLAKLEEQHALMLAVNKVAKSKKSDTEKIDGIVGLGFTLEQAAEFLTPYLGQVGIPSFTLTNSNTSIKRMRERVSVLESRVQRETAEQERPDGVRIVENAEADRLQIFFPGKPDAETIGRLKASGFRWSPSNGCWQRQLTAAAHQAASRVLATDFFCKKV